MLYNKKEFFWKRNYEMVAKEVENHCHLFKYFDIYYEILKEMERQEVKISDEEIEELVEALEEVASLFYGISTFAVISYGVYLEGKGYTVDGMIEYFSKNIDNSDKKNNNIIWHDIFCNKALEYMDKVYPSIKKDTEL